MDKARGPTQQGSRRLLRAVLWLPRGPRNVHPLQKYYGEKDVSTVYIVLGRRTLLALSTNDVDHSRSIQVDTDTSHKQHAI